MSKRYEPAFGGNPRILCLPGNQKALWADCTVASIPADGTAGFEKSAILQVTDGSTGLIAYINSGTTSSCAFRPFLYGSDATAVALTATVAELNHTCDRSLRFQAVGTSLDTSADTAEAYNDKTFLLDTAAGSTLTLPSAVAGYRCRVIVSTAPTGGNSHVISATGTNDTFAGTVAIHDLDGATASWFASSSDNTITLNATTKGGALGDSFTLEAISGSVWAITAATLRCATGSNPATPFSTV
jgi:hypothetical protein